MATPVLLPRQGQSVESCIISKWHKKAGDAVAQGDLLFTYETDKATFDEEAKLSGTFLGAFFEEGDDVPCLLNVCAIGNPGEEFMSFKPKSEGEQEDPAPQEAQAATAVESAPVTSAPTGDGQAFFASPRARNLAHKLNLDVTRAAPTGPNGRVLERDVIALDRFEKNNETFKKMIGVGEAKSETFVHPAPSAIAAYVDQPLTNIRKAIAKNMVASLSNMAQLTHHLSFDATNIMNFRRQLKANGEKLTLPNITLNDIILYAVSRTLANHASLNAHYLADKSALRVFSDVNLGMAVDTERGLLVPTLFGANKLSLTEISAQAKALAKAAQTGTISPDKLSGATFTVSNLGSLDIELFTPVINPPQTGILGVNTIIGRVKEVNGEIKMYPAMGLSLTYDHRALDGAPASKFLKELKTNLENFTLLLAK